MEQDITPKLWESIQKTFWQNLKGMKKGKSYKDADNYADLVGQAMAKAFHDNAVDLPNDKMYFNIADRLINGALRQSHQLVSNYTADAQTALNKQAGLGIKGLTADMDESKAKNLVDVACNADRYADVAPKVEQAMTSFARSVVVDTMKKNVDFHHKLGLSPKIVRKLGAGTGKKRSNSRCEFCRERVGTFVYNKETIDKDIFRRHAHCHCTLEYFPGDGKKQNSWSKRWKDVTNKDFSEMQEQAKVAYQANKKLQSLAYSKALELGYSPVPPNKVVQTLREESKKWIRNLTTEEKRAITKYTYNGKDKDGLRLFEKINGYLSGYYEPISQSESDMLARIVSQMRGALLQNNLRHDIIVYRKDSHVKDLEKPIGKFLSTSVTTRGVLTGKPNVAIIVPKGTLGAYIELLSQGKFKEQREFLFNTGLELEKLEDNGLYIVKRKR
ncbi:ADP-ribosyltransferase [Aerococcus christensenii]|uniref:ADP-ribosyltransferase n=1 Tax=Aerococcus christensenii TaxID=87541 RepID=UPI00254DA3FD|nr:ADP-ribosyltransferase [Aerococcus christensenii]MDK8234485.1 ADP-ribosyltransferase [Aerococcus christensenii]